MAAQKVGTSGGAGGLAMRRNGVEVQQHGGQRWYAAFLVTAVRLADTDLWRSRELPASWRSVFEGHAWGLRIKTGASEAFKPRSCGTVG